MAVKPFGLISDTHFHQWSAFSTTLPSGVNSRLQIIIDEVERAAKVTKDAGGTTLVHAGDNFHVRNNLSPNVLNPVIDMYGRIIASGLDVVIIAGNHDLSSKVSDRLSNATTALEGVGCRVICQNEIVKIDGNDVAFFPWCEDLAVLRLALKKGAKKGRDAIIHAPVNGVIKGLPDHGLEASELATLGYRRVFAGHYHNHVSFEGGKVISIGATTHQTWSDPGTTAGFLLVCEDRIEHFESQAPKFVDLNLDSITDDEIPTTVKGNYVRLKLHDVSDKEIKEWRKDLEKAGALGVNIIATKKTTTGRTGAASKSAVSLAASIDHFIRVDMKPTLMDEVSKAAQAILMEVQA